MSTQQLSSLILSLQHHEQSLHGIEQGLISCIEQAEERGDLSDEHVRRFSSALNLTLSSRTKFHEQLVTLCQSLERRLSAQSVTPVREEQQLATFAPFQTSPGQSPLAPSSQSDSPLELDETPHFYEAHTQSEASSEGDISSGMLGEAPTLEPMLSPLSFPQASPKLQEALSKGETSLDQRLPAPLPSGPPRVSDDVMIFESASPQPSVLPPLMQTPLPTEHTPQAEEPEDVFEEPITEPLIEALSSIQSPSQEAIAASGLLSPEPSHEAPYITYVPPTPEPVEPHTQALTPESFESLVDLDGLDELESSLDQLSFDDSASLPGLSGASSQAQEQVNKRPPRVALGVRVDVTSDVVRFEAMGHDISTGGIFIETDTPLEPGEQLKLRFELDRTAFVVEVTAQVRWCRLEKDSGPELPVGGGLRFLNLSEQASAEIAAFTSGRLSDGI